ncbi:MAG: hypothetical protein AAGF11_01385 [Myxococcota bacterium]
MPGLCRVHAVAVAVLVAPACDLESSLGDDLELRAGLQLAPNPSAVVSVGMGASTTCVVTLFGEVKCWGRNDYGQLGRGDLVDVGDDETPAEVAFVSLGGEAVQVLTNGAQSFALLEDGTVRAWGINSGGELGLQHVESIGDDEVPGAADVVTDVELGGPATRLAVGGDFACALMSNGTASDGTTSSGMVRCWGANDFGQLGRRSTETVGDDEAPAVGASIFLGAPVVDVVAGRRHACALVEGGSVRCWGRGAQGQLGYGGTHDVGDDEFPVVAGTVALGGAAEQIVAGGWHTCARLVGGDVRCWGRGANGQLGYGSTKSVGDDERPVAWAPVSLGGPAVSLAAGAEHTCAVLHGGAVRCWGGGERGQLGYGNTHAVGDDETPAAVAAVHLAGAHAIAVFAGPLARSTCALLDDESLRCWGANDFGQLGYGHVFELGDDIAERPGDLPDILILSRDDDA